MEESNGTNLKPILPIHFLKPIYEIRGVLELRPDSGLDRSRSTSTPRGLKVLIGITYTLKLFITRGIKSLWWRLNKCRILSTLKIVFLKNVSTSLPNYSPVPDVIY
jgi:hypothetical protein